MTALLACDGCGTIASSRPEDEDPTSDWWSLSHGPMIGGGGMLPVVRMEAIEVPLGETGSLPDEEDRPVTQPERHFCTIECIRVWADRTVS